VNMLIPPIKCQGIKTKLVPVIKHIAPAELAGIWIEPLCGSCAVTLNIQPKRPLLTDTNAQIIAFYRAVQDETLTPRLARAFLQDEGRTRSYGGEPYSYEVRARCLSSVLAGFHVPVAGWARDDDLTLHAGQGPMDSQATHSLTAHVSA